MHRAGWSPLAGNGLGDVRIIQYQTLDAEVAGVATLVRDLVAAGTLAGDILILAQRSVIGTPIYEALLAMGVPVRSHYAEAELDDIEAQRRFSLLKLLSVRRSTPMRVASSLTLIERRLRASVSKRPISFSSRLASPVISFSQSSFIYIPVYIFLLKSTL